MKAERYETAEYGFPFIAYIPKNVSEKPAIIFHLHGVGERGNGAQELDKVNVHGLPNVITDENLQNAILICPQCPLDSFWVAKIETMRVFVENIVKKYDADTKRLYLCGLSMGGYGTWYTAQAYPDLFAAIAPCCGGGMVWYAPVLQMPIWAFHGLEDDLVPPNETIQMQKALEGKNDKAKFTYYEGVDHNSWRLGFSPELIEWLLQQHK